MPDMSIGLLFERGEQGPYERITFARFLLEWLTSGADRLLQPARTGEADLVHRPQ
jgi:sialidase-1